jgi:broad specificity phosphatase PhoE
MRRMPFIFVRHGETEGNVKHLCQGKIDFPLTEKGRQQAYGAGEQLKKLGHVNCLFTSTLGRALETTRIIADVLGCSNVITLDGLQERGWGSLEGKANTEMFAQEQRERQLDYDGVSTIEGVETLSEVRERIEKTFEVIHARSKGSVSVVISHGRLFFVLCDLMKVDPFQQVANGVPLLCSPIEDSDAWQVTGI